MTWLSRLRTENTSLHHRAPSSRTREDKGLRRKMTLETLEGRVVLSNVMVSYAGGALTILGDASNDGIVVHELSAASGGDVTVAPLYAQTTVNSFNLTYTSPGPVSSIGISYGAGTASNVEKIVLFGAGKNVPTTVNNVTIAVGSQALGLSVNGPQPADAAANIPVALGTTVTGVDNAGALTLTHTGNFNGPGTTAAQLASPAFFGGNATIDWNTFQSLSMVQTLATATGVSQVELGADAIAGPVTVTQADEADPATFSPPGCSGTSTVVPTTTSDRHFSTRMTEMVTSSQSARKLGP